MPIYEYRCEACGRLTTQLVRHHTAATPPTCHACANPQTRRVMSRFAQHRSEAGRVATFDPEGARYPDFDKDTRHIGLQAKKRAHDLGSDLGTRFAEGVGNARTGKMFDAS